MLGALNHRKTRLVIIQIFAFLSLAYVGYYLFSNTQENLAKQNISTGFGFLEMEAGFEIGESVVDYWPDDSYTKALWVGLLNTLKVAVVGCISALVLGVLLGIGTLSENILLQKISKSIVEFVRNIPLLLQLLFWYALLTDALPPVKEAMEILPSLFVSNRGIFIPFFKDSSLFYYLIFSLIISIALFLFLENRRVYKTDQTSLEYPLWHKLNHLSFILPVLSWYIFKMSANVSYPKLAGFNFNGGHSITPEFLALTLGLIIYTSVFIAEITRAGIESVDKGQWEAARSLNLSTRDTLTLIILPQALRVIIPPLTSQLLNLTKNSSLAVAIGYPDFVSVTNTSMNQTGQAIECISLIMIVYLTFSLSTSLFMNWFNAKFAIIKGN